MTTRNSDDGPSWPRLVSTGLYVLTLLAFSLPFVTASCEDRHVATLTGKDLALGVDLGAGFGSSTAFDLQAGHVAADPWTLIVWLLPLAGIAVVWVGARLDRRLVAASIAAIGAVGTVRMLALLARIQTADDAARRQTDGAGHIGADFGLFFSLALFGAIAVCGAWYLWRSVRTARAGPY